MKISKMLLGSLILLGTFGCTKSSTPATQDGAPAVPSNPDEQVIYGDDGRRNLYEVTDPSLKANAQGVVALFEATQIVDQGARVALQTENFGSVYDLCPTERFRDEGVGAFCSGSLVGPDLVLTAGHCVTDPQSCANTRIVFGFNVPSVGNQVTEVTKNDLYTCKAIVSRVQQNAGVDYALIRLDRAVVGHPILKANKKPALKVGDPLTVMGHPTGLPLKITIGGKVRSISNPSFYVGSVDTYGGNSGSPVFGKTGLIEGVLVRGENDFVQQGSCFVSQKCSETGCRGEDITRISRVPL